MAELWDARGPPRNTRLGRATSTCPRLPPSPSGAQENSLAPRWVQVGRKAFTFIKRHSLAPKGIWLGPRSQILDRIGQTDMMVYRGGSVPSGDAGHCRLRRRSRRDGKSVRTSISNNCSSHLGGPGEPSGATWRPRGHPWRPPECPDGHGRLRRHFPGWEKG